MLKSGLPAYASVIWAHPPDQLSQVALHEKTPSFSNPNGPKQEMCLNLNWDAGVQDVHHHSFRRFTADRQGRAGGCSVEIMCQQSACFFSSCLRCPEMSSQCVCKMVGFSPVSVFLWQYFWPSCGYCKAAVTTSCCWCKGNVWYAQDVTAVHIHYVSYFNISERTTSSCKFT